MAAFFSGIASFFESIGNFIVTSIEWIGKFFAYIGSAVTAALSLFSYIPTDLVIIASVILVASIIFLIVGR